MQRRFRPVDFIIYSANNNLSCRGVYTSPASNTLLLPFNFNLSLSLSKRSAIKFSVTVIARLEKAHRWKKNISVYSPSLPAPLVDCYPVAACCATKVTTRVKSTFPFFLFLFFLVIFARTEIVIDCVNTFDCVNRFNRMDRVYIVCEEKIIEVK